MRRLPALTQALFSSPMVGNAESELNWQKCQRCPPGRGLLAYCKNY